MTSDGKGAAFDRLFNLGLVVVLMYVVALPGGRLRTRFDEWQAQARSARLAQEHWSELAATGARMDTLLTRPAAIIEFGDYTCSFCRRVHPHLMALIAQQPEATIGYRHFPLGSNRSASEGSARAAICAEVQGAFGKMHSRLLESSDWQESQSWRALAAEVGVPDPDEFERCLASHAVEQRLEEDRRLAEIVGVRATPTFLFRYGTRVGYLELDELRKLLDRGR